MVNVGGPSRGCKTCIQRKIRCDRQRPACAQCIKSKRRCGGYRLESDIMFVDQSTHVVAKVLATFSGPCEVSKSPIELPPDVRSEYARTDSMNRTQNANATKRDASSPTVARSPKLNEGYVTTTFFANNYTCGNSMERRTNLFWIPQNFDSLLKDKSVKLSVQCTGAMAMARLQGSSAYAHEAQKQYGLALRSLSQKWQPVAAVEDDAKYLAVLFLSFFEILASYDNSSRRAWRLHLGGLGSLFSKCQSRFVSTEFGGRMYRMARSQIIVHALQSRIPVSGAFAPSGQREHYYAPTTFTHFDDADMLLIRLANLQAECSAPDPPSGLIADLVTLDRDCAIWAKNVPASSTFSAQPSYRQSGLWWDARCDVYISGFVAHLWNKVRAARIVVHDLIQNLLSQFKAHDAENTYHALHKTSRMSPSPKIQDLVTDICATIPLYYRPPCLSIGTGAEITPPPLGTIFWFLWVLEIVGAMREAPSELTEWIAQCFERVYHLTGIIKAQLVAQRLRIGHRGPLLP